MPYQNNVFNASDIAESIHSCDSLIAELKKLDDDKKCALIDALTLKKITNLCENAGHSFSSDDALRRAHDESKRNLIELIGLFPKDRRVKLISSTFRSESTLVSHDPNHDVCSRFYQTSADVYLKDFTETVYFKDGYYNNVVNIPDFVWSWESFVTSLAMYVKNKNNKQIEHALHDVLEFIPEDTAEQFFNEIGVEKLLSFKNLDSLLIKYKICETLVLNEMNKKNKSEPALNLVWDGARFFNNNGELPIVTGTVIEKEEALIPS